MDPRLRTTSNYNWNIGMELVEAADKMNSGHQAVAVCDMYKEALTYLMNGRDEPVGPPPGQKLLVIKKYMEKAEALKHTLSVDEFDTCIEAATRTITKAINYDKEHQYPDALQYYQRGVDYYHRALRAARSEQERATLARNIQPYEKRLAKLQQLVEEGKRQAILATYDDEEGDKPACWNDRLSRATKLATRAVKFDRKRNYVQALDLYTEAITHFLAALRQGQASITPKVDRIIKEKVRQYMERAEAMKAFVQKRDDALLANSSGASYDIGPSATHESFADAIPEAPKTPPGHNPDSHGSGGTDAGSGGTGGGGGGGGISGGNGGSNDDDEFLRRFKELGKDSGKGHEGN